MSQSELQYVVYQMYGGLLQRVSDPLRLLKPDVFPSLVWKHNNQIAINVCPSSASAPCKNQDEMEAILGEFITKMETITEWKQSISQDDEDGNTTPETPEQQYHRCWLEIPIFFVHINVAP